MRLREAWRRRTPLLLAVALAAPLVAESRDGSEAIHIRRASGAIAVDGDLSDAGWRDAERITTWYETNPGDNVEPSVANVGYLAYDDAFLYAAFRFEDPEPERIRAPLSDRDNVPSYTDYGGIIVDANGDGQTAQMFLANARGIQYDAINSDVSGEDAAPDFFWDSVGRITPEGWVLEMRVPFSSLRYPRRGEQRWNIMLYRNRPRDYRYQIVSSRRPREVNCFVCNARPLEGLEELPSGSHWVLAPYLTGQQVAELEGDLGTPLRTGDPGGEIGLDAKWVPNPGTALDATLNPDFSQVESDVPQVAANERFALFFPEKRPFFLEGIDLFKTEIQVVHTRSFTSPRWGGRATGRWGRTSYTALVGEDRGGGSVIIPGPQGSDLADQDFPSFVGIARLRRDLGARSYLSVLYSGREIDGGAHNRVFGPDFQWRPDDNNWITGQLLFSDSRTPDRPDLAEEWDGRALSGHAADVYWWHDSRHHDWFLEYEGASDGFRADNGFVPQAGYREYVGEYGYTFWTEEKKIKRLRTFLIGLREEDWDGNLLRRLVRPGFGLDGPWNSFARIELDFARTASGSELFDNNRVNYTLEVRPSRRVSQIEVSGNLGDQVDFANDRLGSGGTVDLAVNLRPEDHLEVELRGSRRWLDVDPDDRPGGRLFTAHVARLRAVYNFNARAFLRLIGEWVETERDPSLYLAEVEAETGEWGGSLLFAYKLNWQTVLFAGVEESRELLDEKDFEASGRRAFLKLSYAFQR